MSCWGFDFAPLSGLQTGQVASSCVSAVCNFGDLWCATISGPKTCVHVIWYYSDSAPPVPMFCFGPLLTSLHWIVRKSHGVPPLGLDAFCQTRRCWKDFPFANCRPLLLLLDNRSTVESPRKFAHCHVGMGIFSGKILPSPGMLALQKTIRKTTPLGGEGDFFRETVFLKKIGARRGSFKAKPPKAEKKN